MRWQSRPLPRVSHFRRLLAKPPVPDKFEYTESNGEHRIVFGLHFVDPRESLKAVQTLQRGEDKEFDARFLLESPVLFTSVHPFLTTIQSINPLEVPLSRHLISHDFTGGHVDFPGYAKSPTFTWNGSTLLRTSARIKSCILDPRSHLSIDNAHEVKRQHGKLDPR